MWAARKTLLFLQKMQRNQSQPLPFPDDEIIILLLEIWFWIFRLPMYILHMNKTMFCLFQCRLDGYEGVLPTKKCPQIQPILSSFEGQNDKIKVNFKNNQRP